MTVVRGDLGRTTDGQSSTMDRALRWTELYDETTELTEATEGVRGRFEVVPQRAEILWEHHTERVWCPDLPEAVPKAVPSARGASELTLCPSALSVVQWQCSPCCGSWQCSPCCGSWQCSPCCG